MKPNPELHDPNFDTGAIIFWLCMAIVVTAFAINYFFIWDRFQ